jgi:hypothetical protein
LLALSAGIAYRIRRNRISCPGPQVTYGRPLLREPALLLFGLFSTSW